ncbi:MAG: HAMP domain-containing protein, partial [Treponema sp.]|nr:HAMP domain-containing protein [Treponema sp.]
MITFFLASITSLLQHKENLTNQFIQSLKMISEKNELKLNSCFASIENSIKISGDYILRTIDEERILTDPDYENKYMEELEKQMSSITSIAEGVVAIYFRMNVDKFGGSRGIFLESDKKDGYISIKPVDLLQYSPTDIENVGWYYLPIWSHAPVWTNPYINKNINANIISYVIPLYNSKSDLLGVVGMDINLASIKEIIDNAQNENMLSILIGLSNNLIYYSNANMFQKSVAHSAEIREILTHLRQCTEKSKMTQFYWNSISYYGFHNSLENGMKLITAISSDEIKRNMMNHVMFTITVFLITCSLLLLLILLGMKVVINPLRTISKASTKLARGELNISIPYKSKNEIGELAEDIRKMAGQMREYIDYIREQTIRERKAKEEALAASNNKSRFLASMYVSMHELDLNSDTFKEIHSRSDIADAVARAYGKARETVRNVMEERIKDLGDGAKEDFMNFLDFSTLEERMKGRITIAKEFYSILNYWCRARFILIDRNQDGTLHHVIWAVENIDEERAERERLRSEAERNAAASQAKSAFLANMSHEIRTPINAVLGMDEMILRESEDKTILEYAANIKNAGVNLLEIVNEILDFSKIEAGKMELQPENYDVSSIVIDLVNMIGERARKKNLAFYLDVSPSIPKIMYGDSIRIKQCVLNLLTNAVKYTKEGSVTFSISHTKIDDKNVSLTVKIKDTGVGIK